MVSARRGLKVRNLTKTCVCSGASRSWSADLFRKAPEETTYVDPQQSYQYLMQLFFCCTFTHDSISSKIDEEEEDLGKLE